MSSETWPTSITKIEPNKIVLKGYRLDELMGNHSFSEVIYLLIKGELPPGPVGKIVDAIFVSSIDHGVTPPSCQAALKVAGSGGALNASVAAGILAINEFHGGAIEKCMQALEKAVCLLKKENLTREQAAEKLVREARDNKERIMGFGHRVHSNDPRTARLFALAEECGIASDYIEMSREIETALKKVSGKNLPLNVDGAIAALLCELEIPAELANAFFMISRLPGLVAHVYEEKTRFKPMRDIDFKAAVYDGAEERRQDLGFSKPRHREH